MLPLKRLQEIKVAEPDDVLDDDVLIPAAEKHGIQPALMRAVNRQEARMGAFGDDGKATIAIERHQFSRRTHGEFDKRYPSISNPKFRWPKRGEDHPYNWTQEQRWGSVVFMASLNYEAAIQSVSWGAFQIMGFNYKICGFDNEAEFVEAMHVSGRKQFQIWLTFIKNFDCLEPLQNGDLLAFAIRYNTGRNWRDPNVYGNPGYDAKKYASSLATHFKTLSGSAFA